MMNHSNLLAEIMEIQKQDQESQRNSSEKHALT